MTGTVVIFAQEADAPVDAVVRELSARLVEVFRADTSWFPQRLTLDARIDTDGHWSGVLATDQHQVGLEEIGRDLVSRPRCLPLP